MAWSLALSVGALLSGCGLWRPTTVPMRTVSLEATCKTKPSTLLVFLPGSYSLPEDYVSHGFVDSVRQRHIAADIVLVDAHLGYYSERTILDRLQLDVIDPARAAGYRRIWLIGISVGAYGAMLHSAASADRAAGVEGIVAIAPYLGERRVSASIEASGGLARWRAPPRSATTGIDDDLLWQWLQARASRRPEPNLYLGYGDRDRFAFSDRLLAAELPSTHVFIASGGHDWPVWERVWQQMLPALPLSADASCRAKQFRSQDPRVVD